VQSLKEVSAPQDNLGMVPHVERHDTNEEPMWLFASRV